MRLFRGSGCSLMILVVMIMSGCGGNEKTQQSTAPPPEVTVSQVISRNVTDSGVFTGRTDAGDSVDIRARVTGYLTEVAFIDGQEVKPGDLLFQIDARPFKAALDNAEGQKAQWEAKLARAKADVERYEKLVPTGAATPQDLDKAKADAGEATAAIRSAEATIERARLDLEFSRITAPIAGQTSRAMIGKGNLVRGDSELLTSIVSLDPIFVYFDVSERDLLQLREQSRASRPPGEVQPELRSLKIPVTIGLANEEGYPHQGVIDFGENRVDASTGTIQVRATIDNSKRIFKPGLFARVKVPAGDPYQAVLLSDRAIGIDQGMKYVLAVDDKNIVHQRFIEPGATQDDGLRVIKAGLKPDEWVIVNGLQRARPGKAVTPQRAEMPKKPGGTKATPIVTTQSVSANGAAAPAGH